MVTLSNCLYVQSVLQNKLLQLQRRCKKCALTMIVDVRDLKIKYVSLLFQMSML
jgi:hypothetical protein